MDETGRLLLFPVHLLLQEAPHTEEFLDDSTVWGVRCSRALAPSPKGPGDFTSAAQLASTPFHKLAGDLVHALEDKGVPYTLSLVFCHLQFFQY